MHAAKSEIPITPLLVGISESCELLSIKRTFLYKLIAEEKLRPVKLGRRTVFRYADPVAFADKGVQTHIE